MANVTVSSTIDALLQSADAAEAKSVLGSATSGSVSPLSSNALALAEKEWPIKTVTWSSNQTLTYTGGSSTAGHGVVIAANVTTGFVLTVTPTASTIYRNGAVTSLSGTISVPVGKHRFVFWTPDDGATLYMEDTVFSAVDVPVAATPTNYTAATADVEAHLAGINTALASGGWATGILFSSGSSSAVLSNTASETTIFSGTIPANTLGTSGAVRFVMHGQILNNSGTAMNLQMKIKYGATTLFDDTTAALIASNSQSRFWEIRGVLYSDGSTSAQRVEAVMTYSGGLAAPTTGIGDLSPATSFAMAGGSSAEDSTASKTFSITWTCSNYASPTLTVTQLRGIAERL